METCHQIRKAGFNEVPIVFLTANASLPERLKGYKSGGDDFIHKPFDVNEFLVKVNNVLCRKQLLDKAHQEVRDTTQHVNNTMQTLGETGIVIHFLQSTFDCNSYDALAQKVIAAHKQLGLKISIEITLNEEHQYYNLSNTLEKSVFEYTRNRGRLVHSGNHTIVNYPAISIFIHNMPIDNPELNGRIRDYIAVIGEGANSKINALKLELFSKDQKQNLFNFITELSQTIKNIDRAHINQQNENEGILSELIEEIEEAFTVLEMTEKQEQKLQSIIQNSAHKIRTLHDNGLTIDNEFQLILGDISAIIEQNDIELKDISTETNEAENELFPEDEGDVLFF